MAPRANSFWNASRARSRKFAEATNEGLRNLDAGMRGAADIFTFGLADEIAAGAGAVLGGGGRGDLAQRYRALHQRELARDEYDRTHRGGARSAGKIGAVVASVAAPARIVAAVPKVVQGVTRPWYGVQGLHRMTAATGAAGGGLGQAASDLSEGKVSSPKAYAAATLGGAVGAATTPFVGTRAGGALQGATQSALQSAFDGRAPSLDELARDAVAGSYAGGLGDGLGAQTRRLSRRGKQNLGETLSTVKSLFDFEMPRGWQVSTPLSTGKTIADLVTNAHVVEAKFGPFARLTKPQRRALAELGELYRVDRWNPVDVSKLVGALGGGAAAPQVSRRSDAPNY